MILVLFFVSCQKGNDSLPISLDVSQAKVSSTMAMNTKDERRIAFRLLNAAEKAEVWKRHLLDCAKDSTLSNEQRSFISNLIPSLNTERFTTPLKKGGTDSQLEDWHNQAAQLFQEHEVAWIMNDIIKQKPFYLPVSEELKAKVLSKINQQSQVGLRTLEGCSCNSSSDWCGGLQGWENSCIAIILNCTATACNTSDWGCGNWWLYGCAGMCRQYRVNICY